MLLLVGSITTTTCCVQPRVPDALTTRVLCVELDRAIAVSWALPYFSILSCRQQHTGEAYGRLPRPPTPAAGACKAGSQGTTTHVACQEGVTHKRTITAQHSRQAGRQRLAATADGLHSMTLPHTDFTTAAALTHLDTLDWGDVLGSSLHRCRHSSTVKTAAPPQAPGFERAPLCASTASSRTRVRQLVRMRVLLQQTTGEQCLLGASCRLIRPTRTDAVGLP